MMNEMQVFTNEQFGEVRTMVIEGQAWFVAADVCRALEIRNSRDAVKRLDDDERMTVDSTDGHSGMRGGAQNFNVINEPGLYTLVLGSRKPEAKQFKRWITHEVIPSIRKYGVYMTDNVLDRLKERPDAMYDLAEQILKEREVKRGLENELDTAKPKVEYFDAYIDPRGCTCIRNSGKLLGISQKVFVSELLSHKIFFRDPTTGRLLPYSIYEKKGYFIVRDVLTKAGTFEQQTRITPAGKEFLMKKFKQWKGVE